MKWRTKIPWDSGAIVSKLTLDSTNFTAGITKAEKSTKGFGGFVERNSAKIKKMGMVATAASAGILTSFGLMVKKASDAQETTAKFGTVFTEVFPKATAAVQELTLHYGLSSHAAREMLSATGDLLTGLGVSSYAALDLSVKTQRLAVDLASFTNYSGGAKGASDALTKAMLGEREMVKSLGIVITEEMVKGELLRIGKDKLTGLALKQAKAEATLTLAMQQSKNAIGDYERTSRSLANVTRELKARLEDLVMEVGTHLIPAATELAKTVKGVIEKVSNWIKEHPKLTEIIIKGTLGLEVFMGVLGPFLIILPKIAKTLIVLRKVKLVNIAVTKLHATANKTLALSFKALLGPIGLVAAAAAVTYKITKDVIKAKEEMVEADWRAFKAEHKLGQKLREAADAAGMTRREFIELTRKYDDNTAALAMAIHKGKEGKELQEALAKVGAKHKEVIDKQSEALEKQKGPLGDISGLFGKLTEKTKNWTDYLKEHNIKATKETEDRIRFLNETLKGLDQALADDAISLENHALATRLAKDELAELEGREISLEAFLKNHQIETIKDTTKQTNALKEERRRLKEALDNDIITLRVYKERLKEIDDQLKAIAEKTIPVTVLPAVENMMTGWYDSLDAMKIDNEAFRGNVEAKVDTDDNSIKNIFSDVSQRMKDFWTRELGEMLAGAKSFKDMLTSVWNEMKRIFFDVVAKMITKWIVDFLESIFSKTKTIGTKITNLFEGWADAGESAAEGLNTAFGTVLLKLAALATAIVGVKGLLESLFKIEPSFSKEEEERKVREWEKKYGKKREDWEKRISRERLRRGEYPPGYVPSETAPGRIRRRGAGELPIIGGILPSITGWQRGFEGFAYQPVTRTFGEVPEYVKVQPVTEYRREQRGTGPVVNMGSITFNQSFTVRDESDVRRIKEIFRQNVDGVAARVEEALAVHRRG